MKETKMTAKSILGAASRRVVVREEPVGDSRRQTLRLERRVEALLETLRFYSVESTLSPDGGKRAREAIKAAGAKLS
jgi:hypothetical protein